jgi:hypothetical protein
MREIVSLAIAAALSPRVFPLSTPRAGSFNKFFKSISKLIQYPLFTGALADRSMRKYIFWNIEMLFLTIVG